MLNQGGKGPKVRQVNKSNQRGWGWGQAGKARWGKGEGGGHRPTQGAKARGKLQARRQRGMSKGVRVNRGGVVAVAMGNPGPKHKGGGPNVLNH